MAEIIFIFYGRCLVSAIKFLRPNNSSAFFSCFGPLLFWGGRRLFSAPFFFRHFIRPPCLYFLRAPFIFLRFFLYFGALEK